MILMALLLAPTVPSDPNPQNLHWIVPSGSVSIISSTGSERLVTSSTIPTVNPSFGFSALRFLNTARICEGVVSFEPSPYLPPTMIG